MQAVAEAAAVFVVDAFEAVELAVGSAEARGAHQSGEVCAGCIFDGCRQCAFAHCGCEQSGAGFKMFQIRGGVVCRGPGVGESLGIVIADDGFLVALGSFPSAPLRRAIREMPGQNECVASRLAWCDGTLQAQGADGTAGVGFIPEPAVVGEIVPEKHGRIPPPALRPTAPMRKQATFDLCGTERESAVHWVVSGDARIAHNETGKAIGRAEFILTGIRVQLCDVGTVYACSDGIFDRERHGNLGFCPPGIRHVVSQECNGKARFLGVMRDERRKSVERDFHGKLGVLEIDVR